LGPYFGPLAAPIVSRHFGGDSPRGIDRGQSIGARVPPGDRVTGGNWLLPTNRLGLGRLRRFGPSPAARATFRYASLRARRGAHSKNRARKVQGARLLAICVAAAAPRL